MIIMDDLNELNWLNQASEDLMYYRHTYRAYSEYYAWAKWIRS